MVFSRNSKSRNFSYLATDVEWTQAVIAISRAEPRVTAGTDFMLRFFLASWDAIEPGLVSQSVSAVSDSKNRVDWCDPGEWRYLLKTLLMILWRLMIHTYGDDVREIVVLVMEVDKVADEVTWRLTSRLIWWIVVNITDEEFIGVTLLAR